MSAVQQQQQQHQPQQQQQQEQQQQQRQRVQAPRPNRAKIEEMSRQGARPAGPAYHDTPLLSVGKHVRVKGASQSRRALIECVDEAEGTVDVLYCGMGGADGQGGCAEEEGTVGAGAVRALEDFEVAADVAQRGAFAGDLHGAAAAAKERGNALFKLQDYEAAALFYGLAIDELRESRAPPAPGAECWVLMNQGGALVLGSVRKCSAGGESAEVAYRGGDGQLQVYPAVPWRVLIPVHEAHLPLHCSLYTNRAKSLVQLGLQQDAARDLTVVIGLWSVRGTAACGGPRELTPAEVAEQREQLAKAHYLRAKTRLARLKVGPARADVADARALQPPAAMAGLLQRLEKEIELAQREQVRSNKRIAKEVAKWADKAMENFGSGYSDLQES